MDGIIFVLVREWQTRKGLLLTFGHKSKQKRKQNVSFDSSGRFESKLNSESCCIGFFRIWGGCYTNPLQIILWMVEIFVLVKWKDAGFG